MFSAFRITSALLVLCLVVASPVVAAEGVISDIGVTRTLKRKLDPVVTDLKDLTGLHGRKPEEFKLFAYRVDRGFIPIPYQFDEVDPRGHYVFQAGPDSRPDADKGLLDANDELVFMAADTGDKTPTSLLPGAGTFELEITDPVDGSKAWAYLLPVNSSPETAPADYVNLNEKTLEVTARDYIFHFDPAAPIVFNYLAIRHPGQEPVNIVDRMKIRAWAKVLGLFKVHVTEEDLKSELRGYIDGPVRAIRRSRNTYAVAFIPTMRTDLVMTFYPSHFMADLTGRMPIDADTFVSEGYLRVAIDYTKDILGAQFRTGTLKDTVTFTGKPDALPPMASMNSEPFKWGSIFGFGPDQSDGWFSRMIPGPTLPSWFLPYVRDNDAQRDPPERELGVHDIGFASDRMVEMKQGVFNLQSFLYRTQNFTMDDVPTYMQVTDKPLVLRSRSIEFVTSSSGKTAAPAAGTSAQ